MTEVAEVKTIGDVERIVHGSGMWDGTGPVEFSNDGERWVEAWAPTEEHPHPEFARVAVHRKEVMLPKKKTIRWDDYVPRGDGERSIFWLAQWTASPSRHLDRIARMVTYRETFRDLIGNLIIEGEDVDHAPAPSPSASGEQSARDWAAEIDGAASLEALDAIDKAARAVKAFTPDKAGTDLHRQLRVKRKALAEEAARAWEPLSGQGEFVIDPDSTHSGVLEMSDTPAYVAPRRPQDHLPGNRASRRAKKKRGHR